MDVGREGTLTCPMHPPPNTGPAEATRPCGSAKGDASGRSSEAIGSDAAAGGVQGGAGRHVWMIVIFFRPFFDFGRRLHAKSSASKVKTKTKLGNPGRRESQTPKIHKQAIHSLTMDCSYQHSHGGGIVVGLLSRVAVVGRRLACDDPGGGDEESSLRSDDTVRGPREDDSALSSVDDASWCGELADGGFSDGLSDETTDDVEDGRVAARGSLGAGGAADRGTWIDAGNVDLYGSHFADDGVRALRASRELVESLRGELLMKQDELRERDERLEEQALVVKERDEENASLRRDMDLQSAVLEDTADELMSRDAENARLKCQVAAELLKTKAAQSAPEESDQVRVVEWTSVSAFPVYELTKIKHKDELLREFNARILQLIDERDKLEQEATASQARVEELE